MVTKRRSRAVPLWRWVFTLAAIGGFCTGMIFAARSDLAWLAALAGVLFTVPLCSLGEWLVHGVLYHGRVPGLAFIRNIHHNGHHFAIFPPTRYIQRGPYEFMRFRKPVLPFRMSDNAWDNFLTMYSQVALHFVVGLPLILWPAWALTGSVAFTVSCLATLSVVSWLLGYVHGVIHTPRNRLIERARWFQWLNHHHYIHHIDLRANVNFMLPICDVLLGTQKAALTPDEAAANPTFEEAATGVEQAPATREHPGRRAA
jgi:hypothetical protein